jgi:hypothetical protein
MTSQTLYINTIDECVNNIIDTFYLELIENKKYLKKVESEEYLINKFNTLKEDILKLISTNVDKYKINEIITNKDEYDIIINLFKNYVLLYFFFNYGLNTTMDNIINIINKLNVKYTDDFFKNKYLMQYSIYYGYIKDYYIVLTNIDFLGIKPGTTPNFEFINKYNEVITSIKNMDTEVILSLIENKEDIIHNILKIVIFREIYLQEDKLTIFKILENEELKYADYKYIDIVDAIYDTIDYATIESLFSITENKKGLAEEVYKMINDYEATNMIQDYPINNKINQLFKKKILIPITDEFLRYHKDSELYDNDSNTKIDPRERVNKKDNTKIRYIVTKINKIKDYYNPSVLANNSLRSEIEKNFYQPLMYRKVVIINDIEEIGILKKIELQGKSVIESNEYYDDLIQIRKYPYIEFKFTNNDSFSFNTDFTIETLRYCNFEFKDDPKYSNINNTELQYRVINNSIKANIVGVAIPRFNLLDTNDIDRYNQTIIPCHKVKDTMNMSLLHNNGYSVCIRKLRKLFMEDKRYSKMLYWIFNKKNDQIKLKLFDNINLLPKDEYIKLLLGNIYDEIVKITYEKSLYYINQFDYIDTFTALNIIKKLESKLVLIPKQSVHYSELMKLIYYIKLETSNNIKDALEEKIPGVNSSLIKLPTVILEKIIVHIINIKKHELSHNHDTESDIYEGYTCQHIITWNKMMKIKKSDPNKFNQELYNFIKKYVIENDEKDYVCKSCYQLIDLRNYTTEIYPGSDSIVISYGLTTELETINEYVKYTKIIKNLDKIIERITYSSNITYYVGSSQETKFRRQEIIKNIIDIIDIQYKTLYSKETNIRKERLEKSIKKYGCNMTNFFLFKLDNDIFTYSSKETDKFKLFKLNNILTYILMQIVLEINLSQILFLSFDKLVNYFLFTKFGFNLFDNLYIRISNKNDIAPIKNYKLLCYIIYYISGIYAKLNMWYNDNIPFKPNNINPQIQRFIIHTFIDCLNSILEVNTQSDKHYLYSIFATKFYNKLNNIYNNNSSKDVIANLDNINKKKVFVSKDNKLKYNISTIDNIKLLPYISDGKYMMESSLGTFNKVAPYPNIKFIKEKLNDLNPVELIGDKKLKEIDERLYNESLHKIASLYDITGIKRSNILSSEEVNKLSEKELKKIYEAVYKYRINDMNKVIKKTEHKLEKINVKNIKNLSELELIEKKYNNELDDVINSFMIKIESLIGKNLNINNSNFYLNDNVYIIGHDYIGNKKAPIFILEKENKIKFKKDDDFFKQDVYYYEDTINHVTVYYSTIERFLIGYKEASKDYTKIINTDAYLKINYSIRNQLKLFGFNYINYKINNIKNINEFINNIMKIRLQNLKNSLSNIQQIIYQVKNNYNGSNLNPIAKYYINKIKSIQVYNDEGDRIFKDSLIVSNNLFHNNIELNSNIHVKTLPNGNNYIKSENLVKLINDITLFYIIDQFNMLIDINTDNYTRVNIAYMIINIIMQLFRNFLSNENALYDINVKKFYHYITTKAEISDFTEEVNFSSMTEEEIEKYKDEQYNDKESIDALDVSNDDTNEDFGDEDILLVDRTGGEY